MDTVMSFMYYTRVGYRIVLMDGSDQGVGTRIQEHYPWLEVVFPERPAGGGASLYVNLSLTYKQILQRYRFDVLLKLDTDALVTGPEPEQPALETFRCDPLAGIGGQYPNDYRGRPQDAGRPGKHFLHSVLSWEYIRRPRANLILRRHYHRALTHGYRPGESVFGGAYFMSERLLQQLDDAGLLPDFRLRNLSLDEDRLFALLARSQGFTLVNLSEGDLPFACAGKGLPDSPEELLLRGKKIIHSTRCWGMMDEGEIRHFFRRQRVLNHMING